MAKKNYKFEKDNEEIVNPLENEIPVKEEVVVEEEVKVVPEVSTVTYKNESGHKQELSIGSVGYKVCNKETITIPAHYEKVFLASKVGLWVKK